ncbi:hypothetical protein [Streptomyces sp. NPDC058872]|uniref:hypothetical protein n=1 Tax=Streptomyces sp. NPDC058872 TaxID=3346661 RepID=UPI0036913509
MTQPTNQQAYDNLYDGLTKGVQHAQIRGHLLDQYRAAVLREAAELIRTRAEDGDFNAPEYGSHENVLEAADMLDQKAEEAHT